MSKSKLQGSALQKAGLTKEVKPNKVKAKVTDTVSTVSRVVKNAEQLVIASALMITTVFSYTHLKTVTNDIWYYLVLASVITVGLVAFTQFVKFLNRN